MSTTNSSRNGVVRSGSTWSRRALICLIAFVATGAAVIWMSSHQARRAQWYSATATIWHRLAPPNIVQRDPSKEPPGLDLAAVQGQIVSDQNLRQAISRLEYRPPDGVDPYPWSVADETIKDVRGRLRATCARQSSPGRSGVSVTYLDRDANRAQRLVNVLAQGYAEQHRAKLEATVHQDYLKARDAAELARQAYLDAKARFEDFVGQHFLKQQALAQREVERRTEPDWGETPPTTDSASGAVEVTPQQPIEDSEQIVVGRHLADLQQRRAQLLLSRTPAHPEVEYVDIQIAELEERLASLPGQTAERAPVLPPSQDSAWEAPPVESLSDTSDAAEPEETVEQYGEAVRAHDAHKEALDQARQEYDRLSETKRRAWERELRAVSVELDLADGARLYRPADRSPRSLLGALAAALAVALGVGVISSGFDTDLPLATPSEVERALRVPVVGRIPARESSPARTAGRRSRRARRLAKILGGTLLVAVCFGILVVVL